MHEDERKTLCEFTRQLLVYLFLLISTFRLYLQFAVSTLMRFNMGHFLLENTTCCMRYIVQQVKGRTKLKTKPGNTLSVDA